MVELIKMLFGIWTQVGPKTLLDGVQIPTSKGQF